MIEFRYVPKMPKISRDNFDYTLENGWSELSEIFSIRILG